MTLFKKFFNAKYTHVKPKNKSEKKKGKIIIKFTQSTKSFLLTRKTCSHFFKWCMKAVCSVCCSEQDCSIRGVSAGFTLKELVNFNAATNKN